MHVCSILISGIFSSIFAVFLVFSQNRYGTETTVSHVSNTEYRYRIKIFYTAMHCSEIQLVNNASEVQLVNNTSEIQPVNKTSILESQ